MPGTRRERGLVSHRLSGDDMGDLRRAVGASCVRELQARGFGVGSR